jgi:hypothetical protein
MGCSRDSELDREDMALYRSIHYLQGQRFSDFFGKAKFARSLTEMQIASVIVLVTFGKNGH